MNWIKRSRESKPEDRQKCLINCIYDDGKSGQEVAFYGEFLGNFYVFFSDDSYKVVPRKYVTHFMPITNPKTKKYIYFNKAVFPFIKKKE